MTTLDGTVVTTMVEETGTSLRRGSLSLIETISQSVANMAPTLTPAINITVVASLAGVGAWLSYLVATIGVLFVGFNIASLAGRHSVAGSYFLYIGRALGPSAGVLAGWSMIAAYVVNAICVAIGAFIFATNFMVAIGLANYMPPQWLFDTGFTLVIGFMVFRDVKFSSRISLVLESVSISVILIIAYILVSKHHGGIAATKQIDFKSLSLAPIMLGLTFATFSFAGFESSATLSKESRNPKRSIPIAIIASTAFAGIFFIIIAYCMMLAVNDNASTIANSSSPFAEMTQTAGLPWAAAVIYFAAFISSIGCNLANFNAASRIMYSMSSYSFIHSSMKFIHTHHRTPAKAILFCTIVTILGCLAFLGCTPVNAFGYSGTFAVFGFVLIYFLICAAAPLDLFRAKLLRVKNVIIALIGGVLMLGVGVGAIYPLPPYPYNIIPYLFLAYMAAGAVWVFMLKTKNPSALLAIELDLEA